MPQDNLQGAGAQASTDLIAWDSHGELEVLIFELGGETFALEAGLVREVLDRAQALTAAEYDEGRRTAHHARRALKELFGAYDAILTYATVGRAPAIATTGDPRFNRLWTLMGVPCVNVPVPGDGLPLGVQVIARFSDDGRALAVARMIEDALARA